jgi:N-acetylglutamate synthase-like GNAT family acetyltransferase
MASKQITIRNLGPEETFVLERVRPGICDEFDLTRAWSLLATRINEFVVALDQGEVVGFVYGSMIMHPDKPNEFLVSAIHVHDDHASGDVSVRLVDRIRDLAMDRGCEVMWMVGATPPLAGDPESSSVELVRWDL